MRLSPWSSTSLLCPDWGNPAYRRQFTWKLRNASGTWVTSTKCKFYTIRSGTNPSQYTYLFIFWPESFLLNMKAIFEHWTVTLLGCLLVDKTWKSNLLSWAVSKFTVEKGEGWKDKPHSPTSLKFLPVFLRNEMEAGGEMTHREREDPMTVFLFLLLCLPAPYFRGLFSGITLLCRSRSRENIRASPGLSAKLWSHREQIPLPCSAPLTHT